jgi:hypothetical protein
LAKDDHDGSAELTATARSGVISGTIVFVDSDDKDHPTTHRFTATPVPQRRGGAPQCHDFTPSTFYRQFSAATKPVLTVFPGDTIHTSTVDAGGTDEKSVARVLGGNPKLDLFTLKLKPLWTAILVKMKGGFKNVLASRSATRSRHSREARRALDWLLRASAAYVGLRCGCARPRTSASGDRRFRALGRQHGLQ